MNLEFFVEYVCMSKAGELEIWLFVRDYDHHNCLAFVSSDTLPNEPIAFNLDLPIEYLLKQYNRTCLGPL